MTGQRSIALSQQNCRFDRTHEMKSPAFYWIIATVLAVCVLTTLMSSAVAAAPVLRFFTWADYISPELIKKFEQESGIPVELVPFTTNDQLLEALKSGHSGFDLTIAGTSLMDGLIRGGLIEKIDVNRLPNYGNIDEVWRSAPFDPNNLYSAPFDWGTTSFVVDTAVYHGDIDTLGLLFNPPDGIRGHVSFLVGAEEGIKMGLTYLGLPPCSSDPKQLEKVMALIRPQLGNGTIATISTAIDMFTSDRIVVAMAWNGDALRARERKPSLRYAYPREGLMVWIDLLVVPKGAAHVKEALRFIDFVLRPENIALQSNFSRYANVISGSDAYMTPDILAAPEVIIPAQIKLNFHAFCPSDITQRHVKIWGDLVRAPPQ